MIHCINCLYINDHHRLSVFATICFRNNCVECSSCWRNSMISSFVLTVTLNVCLISIYFGHKNTWYSSSTVSVHNSQVRCSLEYTMFERLGVQLLMKLSGIVLGSHNTRESNINIWVHINNMIFALKKKTSFNINILYIAPDI